MKRSHNLDFELWRDQIELDYGHLREDQTEAGQVCPACKGGAREEKSLSVSRRGGALLWNCHRASCAYSGASGYSDRTQGGGTRSKIDPCKVDIKVSPLNQATVKLLATKYGISRDVLGLAELGWSGDSAGNYGRRVCFPIFGPNSEKRGINLRSYQGADPKSIIEMHTADDPILCWYKHKRASNTLVLVEDQMSALKLSPYVHAAALLGVNLSEAKVNEIKAQGYKRVILSLDNDAIPTAIKLTLKWKDKLPGLCIMGLMKDIKDMTADELKSHVARLAE